MLESGLLCAFGLALVGRESVSKEGGEGRGLQDCDQEPRAHHRAVHEAKQHDRHLRGGRPQCIVPRQVARDVAIETFGVALVLPRQGLGFQLL